MTLLQTENLPGTRNTALELNCVFDKKLLFCPAPAWLAPPFLLGSASALPPQPSYPSSLAPSPCSSPCTSRTGSAAEPRLPGSLGEIAEWLSQHGHHLGLWHEHGTPRSTSPNSLWVFVSCHCWDPNSLRSVFPDLSARVWMCSLSLLRKATS